MASLEAISCPLCLQANEPDDLVDFIIPSDAVGPRTRMGVCRACAAAIAESLENSDAGRPYRAPSNGDTLPTDPSGGGPVLAGDAADRPLVLPGESADEGSRGDRREPESVTGGDAARPDDREAAESSGLDESGLNERTRSHKK